MNNLDKLRESFEADFSNRFGSPPRRCSSDITRYATDISEFQWQAYQAAHISAVKQCAKVTKDAENMWGDDFTKKYGDITAEQAVLALLPTNESEANNER